MNLVIFKLWYLFYFAANSCLNPFLNVIFRRYGIQEQVIGGIALLRPLIGLPGGIIFSAVADKYRKHAVLLLLCLAVSTLMRSMLYYYSSMVSHIIVLVLISGATSAPCTTIMDSACSAACSVEGETYARQRMFGAIGWGTFSFISGSCIDMFGIAAAFILHGVLMVGTAGPTYKVDFGPLEGKLQAHREHAAQPSFSEKIYILWSNIDARVFFFMTLIMGTAVGTIEGFLFLYIEDLGGSSALMGLTLTVTCVSETIVFYFSSHIINFLGISRSIHVCFLAFFVRLTAYVSMMYWPSVWFVLPVELLHGLTFGLTWSVGTKKSQLLSPPGLEATTQSVFQGCMFGLGYGLGGLLGGSVYSHVGATATFVVELCILSLGWIGSAWAEYMLLQPAAPLKPKYSGPDLHHIELATS